LSGYSGLQALARRMTGRERIHMGVRPNGFHAGNALALVAYPLLLLRELARVEGEVECSFIVSINDLEPSAFGYPLGQQYPNNVVAMGVPFGLTPDPYGCCTSISRHQEPIIRRHLAVLEEEFPQISVSFVRNSELRHTPEFRSALLTTLSAASELGERLSRAMNCRYDPSTAAFAGAVCAQCHSADGRTTVVASSSDGFVVRHRCGFCGKVREAPDTDFDFWWHYAPLRAARAACLRFDVHVTGGDHLQLKDLQSVDDVIALVAPTATPPIILASPMLLCPDGRKMATSFGNGLDAPLEELLELARGSDARTLSLLPDAASASGLR